MKIEVNGEKIFSNYPQDSEHAIEDQEDFKVLTLELRLLHLQDPSLLCLKIDAYRLPSLLNKMIKSMKKNQVAILTTTRIDKLHTNFPSDFLD